MILYGCLGDNNIITSVKTLLKINSIFHVNLSRRRIWEIIILGKIDEIGLALFVGTLKYIIMSKKLLTDFPLKKKRFDFRI